MPPKILTHKHYLHVLIDPELDTFVKKTFIKRAHEPVVQLISNLCLNILKKNIEIPEEVTKKLRKNKYLVLILATPRQTYLEKRRFISKNFDEIFKFLPDLISYTLKSIENQEIEIKDE